MTLTTYDDLEQGSPEWHDVRRGILTASTVSQFITPKTIKAAANDKTRSMAYQLVAERITMFTEPSYTSADMEDGHIEEPLARDKYSENYALASEVGFMVRDFGGFRIGFSPDGVVGSDGIIELKSRAQKKHLQTIIADEVPAENIGQVMCGLLISGRAWCDYVSYCGGMKLWVKRVYPDQRWFDAILEVGATFEESAASMIATYHAATEAMPDTERPVELEEMRI